MIAIWAKKCLELWQVLLLSICGCFHFTIGNRAFDTTIKSSKALPLFGTDFFSQCSIVIVDRVAFCMENKCIKIIQKHVIKNHFICHQQ